MTVYEIEPKPIVNDAAATTFQWVVVPFAQEDQKSHDHDVSYGPFATADEAHDFADCNARLFLTGKYTLIQLYAPVGVQHG